MEKTRVIIVTGVQRLLYTNVMSVLSFPHFTVLLQCSQQFVFSCTLFHEIPSLAYKSNLLPKSAESCFANTCPSRSNSCADYSNLKFFGLVSCNAAICGLVSVSFNLSFKSSCLFKLNMSTLLNIIQNSFSTTLHTLHLPYHHLNVCWKRWLLPG